MTSEALHDLSLDRQNRPCRPKLLKLTDVSMPNRSRKKTKFKLKERSQSNVRERIYDDPAYTDDISHLAVPLRRNSGPDKVETLPLPHKRKSGHKDQYVKRYETTHPPRDGSSSSENMPIDTAYHKRGQSLERTSIIERSPKKREKRDRAAKQKRNLSLDNALSSSLRRSLEKSENPVKPSSIDRSRSRQKPFQRQNASEGWSSCLAATSDSSKATENEEMYSSKKEPTKMQIGKRFLRGEIGIKSFNYYLLKEGLKSSKKFMDKQRNSLTKSDAKKLAAKSEENIYEEIFFMDKGSETEETPKYPECELCVQQQCTTENCEYCLEDYERSQMDYYNRDGAQAVGTNPDQLLSDYQAKGAHILQYQSYNPNNPGVYKIETTPVAFTSDYNPLHHLQVPSKTQPQPIHQQTLPQRGKSAQVVGGRVTTKSSSSSDSLHHKYGKHRNSNSNSQDFYECPQQMASNYAVPHSTNAYDQKIYKSDSRVSILSEYSVRSESSHRDSSLGDSMFSYSTQRKYFGSSESCRFGFECRRCSLDGEKCSFSDTCRYECRNCDCSSSYFSSDFDDVNNSRKSSTRLSSTSQKSYEYYNDTVDVKQNKYAQDFIKHVNDVKRSIYQAELQRTSMTPGMNPFGTVPPPKPQHLHQNQPHPFPATRRGSSPFKSFVTFGNRDTRTAESTSVAPSTKISITNDPTPPPDMCENDDDDTLTAESVNPNPEPVYVRRQSLTVTSSPVTQNVQNTLKTLDPKEDKKKQTGAIPKSGTPSSASSGRSQRSGKESGGNSSGGSCRSVSDYATIQKLTPTPSKRNSPTTHVETPVTSSESKSVEDTKTVVSTRAPPTQTVETVTLAEPQPIVVEPQKVKSPSKGDHKSHKARKSRSTERRRSRGPSLSEDAKSGSKGSRERHTKKEGNPESTTDKPKQAEPKPRKKKEPKDEASLIKPQPPPVPAAPSNAPQPAPRTLTEWSEDEVFEEEDDDVFIDPEKEKLRKKRPIARKRALALPATPKTPENAISRVSGEEENVGLEKVSESTEPNVKSETEKSIHLTATTTATSSTGSYQDVAITDVSSIAPKTTTTSTAKSSESMESDTKIVDATKTTTTSTTSVAATRRSTKHFPRHTGSLTDGGVGSGMKAHTIPRSASTSSKAHWRERIRPSANAEPLFRTKPGLLNSMEVIYPPLHHRQKTKHKRSVRNEMREGGLDRMESAKATSSTSTTKTATSSTTPDTTVTPATRSKHRETKMSESTPDVEIYATPCDATNINITTANTTTLTATATAIASPYATPKSLTVAAAISAPTRTAGVVGSASGGTSAEEISCKSDVAGGTVNRDQSSSKPKKHSRTEGRVIDTSEATSTDESRLTKDSTRSSDGLPLDDKIDISDLPLPEIPPKKRRSKITSRLWHHGSLTTAHRDAIRETFLEQQRQTAQKHLKKLESFGEEKKKMHYHNMGHVSAVTPTATNNQGKPTYLFGENRAPSKKGENSDEIYLNKSGWVQVNQKRINDENAAVVHNRKATSVRLEGQNGGHKNTVRVIQVDKNTGEKPVYAVPRAANSKIEELISRSEARRGSSTTKVYMRPGYKIVDPQISSILNERPGFLPVKTFMDIDSPPPVTPILSPPPAFQDSKGKNRCVLNNNNVSVQINVGKNDPKAVAGKGMVFSRSFEYDRKHPADYAETFSKSFDSNLSDQRPKPQPRDRSPNFSALTGASPNYLTKKDSQNSSSSLVVGSGHSSGSGKSRDSSPKYQQIGTAYIQHTPNVVEKPVYSTPRKLEKYGKSSLDRNGRSRRAQFTRIRPTTSPGNSRYRSFDTGVSQRLNSCDSGARSDLSNDEIDDDDEMSSQFLTTNYQSQGSYGRSQPNAAYVQKQRSITPERYDNSLRKQRSLTPESRSLTPEERRKRGSQVSLNSSHSRSRTSTLERKQKFDEKSRSNSRSSSSSSYSGREYDTLPTHRRSATRNAKLNEEHRIRRSRSLQLSEKSPSRSSQPHKMVICLGSTQQGSGNQAIYQQPMRNVGPNMRQSQRQTDQSSTSRHTGRSNEADKSRSFDFDYAYNSNAQNANMTRMDFDKSRSFDENYREQGNKVRYITEPGSIPIKLQRSAAIQRQTSPQNYGTRLCDHELTYDMLRRTYDRSPIMDFSRDHDLRDSELNYLNERIYDQAILLCDQSPGDGAWEPMTPECEYIYRQPIHKSQHHPQRSMTADRSTTQSATAAPPIGSCTATSCDFWPHCGVSKFKSNKQSSSGVDHHHHQNRQSMSCGVTSCSPNAECGYIQRQPTGSDDDHVPRDDRDERDERDDDNNNRDNDNNIDVDNNFRGRVALFGDVARVGDVTLPGHIRSKSLYRKSYSLNEPWHGKPNVIVIGERVGSKSSQHRNAAKVVARTNSSSVVYLGEREMPITREREMPTSPTTIRVSSCGSSANRRIIDSATSQPLASGGSKYHNTSATTSTGGKTSRSNSLRTKQVTPVKKFKESRRPRSLSLPNILLQVQYSPSDTNGHDPFSSNLAQQMRAVSSPSLCESPLDNLKPKYEICQNTDLVPCENVHQNYVGVLQKFKKTFSQFNRSKSVSNQTQKMDGTTTTASSDCDPTRYRFGPLIWRSSKERRKAKHNRRDKCNSGDSGIQIELDNDEPSVVVHDGISGGLECLENISPSPVSVRIRRANSAKAGNSMTSCSSAKAKALKKIENNDSKIISTPIPTRSLSQPSGLDRMSRSGTAGGGIGGVGDVDESDTDSVSSHPDLHEVGSRPIYAEVLFPFTPGGPQELALEKGALIEIIRKDTGPWWLGRVKHEAVLEKILEPQQGWFPKDFVRILPSPFEVDHHSAPSTAAATATTTPTLPANKHNSNVIDCNNAIKYGTACDNRLTNAATNTGLSKNLSSSPSQQHCVQNSETLRNNVIKELLETEINYVKLLSSLCLGYFKELQKRVDIFSTECLNVIFSNIESIWQFQQNFLDALRRGIENGRIAQVFLEHQSGFMVYSTYCNSYPRALMELESYSSVKEANIVLENCRIAENLPELPLSAHLLAPIQRICRYPLHLAELVKHTPPRQSIVHIPDNSDAAGKINDGLIDCKEALEYALAAMKKVTEMVNEGKRHSENLTRFQTSFENFQGPPLAFHSTRFFMQTDATRVSPNLWNNTYTLFLFDHQLVYCKKDLLKRNHYIYKGRIFLDSCRILNLPDGKLFGATLKNALRLYCEQRDKSFDFCFRSASRKIRFLSTLAAERQFCGTSIFVSEFAGDDDEHLSDHEYHSDYDTPKNTIERGAENNFNNLNVNWKDDVGGTHESLNKHQKYSDTLPKKSRKVSKDGYEYNTGSLGRRKIGNWFRKAKSTNTTPTQSPTHHSVAIFNSDSSSQSSPALGYKTSKAKIKDPTVQPS